MDCTTDLECSGKDVCCEYSCVPPVINSCYGSSCDNDLDCFGDFTCCDWSCYHQSSVFCNPADNVTDNLLISVSGIVFFIILIASVVTCVRRRRAAAIIATSSTVVAVSTSTTGHATYGGTGQTTPNLHSQYYQGTCAPQTSGYSAISASTTLPPPPPYQEIAPAANAKSPLLS